MRPPQQPLTPEETTELTDLLENAAGRTLPFARGVFAAVATAPSLVEPTDWMSLLLAREPPDRASLVRLFGLLIREYHACAECLALGVPAVPSAEESEGIVQFCKGYIRVSQGDSRWTQDSDAFALTVPLAWLAGYVGDEALRTLGPTVEVDVAAFRATHQELLAEDVARLYEYWAEARRKRHSTVTNAEKIGRNEPCPCGSGKKYKKCYSI
jgi:hypothetical protein